MNLILLIIFCVLVYIAYQLYRLNLEKKQELTSKMIQKEDDRISELMPNFHNKLNSNTITTFLSKYPNHLEKYYEIQEQEKNETDSERKNKMKKIIDDIKESVQQIYKTNKITEYEVQFIIWSYINHIYKDFPNIDLSLCDYVELSWYKDILSVKN